LTAACGGGGAGGGGAGADPAALCEGEDTHFAGIVQYEDRPYDTNGFAESVLRPVRYARVAMIDGALGNPLGTAVTDSDGAYCISTQLKPATAFLRVRSLAVPPQAEPGAEVAVAPDGNPAHVYQLDGVVTSVDDLAINRVADFVIRQDTLMPVSATRAVPVSGAFNIMDVVTYGYEAIHTAWGVQLPQLEVQWQWDAALGTHYHPGDPAVAGQVVIHINGAGGGDSDEYDDDTVLHEFGHFVYDQVGRSDSPGGQHFINGYTQDARLAYSEGWASFLSAMIRDVLPVSASNRSGPQWMISPYPGTDGALGALAWAYEMDTATALVADQNKPNYDTAPVGADVFQYRVKTTTSEVSVSAALWDIYKGVSGANGIGAFGILSALLDMKGNGLDQTFGSFWERVEQLYRQDQARVLTFRSHLVADRKMPFEDDLYGYDDSFSELEQRVAEDRLVDEGGGGNHLIRSITPTRSRVLPLQSLTHGKDKQFTLFPEGDVDLYQLEVTSPGIYRITTTDLSNGGDPMMELLDANQQVMIVNDTYLPLRYRYWGSTASGLMFGEHTASMDLNCNPDIVTVAGTDIYLPSCPPNAANFPGQNDQLRIPEYYGARIVADLSAPVYPATYYVRVSRSPNAPVATDIHGSYRLLFEQIPPAP